VVVAAAGILSQEPRPPRELRPDLPVAFEQTILKALDKDRARRYQSAMELQADLVRVKQGARAPLTIERPVMAERSPTKLPAQQRRDRRWRALVFVVAIFAISTAGKWIQSVRGRPPQAAQQAAPAVANQPTIQPPQPQAPTFPEPAPPPAEPPAGLADASAKAAPSPPALPPLVLKTPSGVTAEAPASAVSPPPAAVEAPFGRASRPRGGRAFGPGGPALVKLLQNVAPETYDLVYAADDAAAMTMALQIRAALEKAGWTNASTMEIAQPQAKLGIFAPRPTAGISTLTNWAVRQGLQPDVRRVASLSRLRIVIGKQQ
jgi:hypothetical protein